VLTISNQSTPIAKRNQKKAGLRCKLRNAICFVFCPVLAMPAGRGKNSGERVLQIY